MRTRPSCSYSPTLQPASRTVAACSTTRSPSTLSCTPHEPAFAGSPAQPPARTRLAYPPREHTLPVARRGPRPLWAVDRVFARAASRSRSHSPARSHSRFALSRLAYTRCQMHDAALVLSEPRFQRTRFCKLAHAASRLRSPACLAPRPAHTCCPTQSLFTLDPWSALHHTARVFGSCCA